MRILLTGAAGFVGSHLVQRFLAQGHEVVGVDNLSTGRRQNIAHLETQPGFMFLERDVCVSLRDEPFLEGPLDWVLHFASPASPPRYLALPVETLRVNSEGTRLLLDLCRARGAAFFLASTSEVYGDPEVHPQREDYWGNVNPNGPRSVYDEAKRYAEAITMAYHRSFGLPVRVIRIFNTYGPRMDPEDGRVVSNFIVQALRRQPITVYGAGTQTRSFQYVDDLVEGIVRLMGVDYPGPVNLGNPEEYTMLELAMLVRKLVGGSSEIVHAPLPADDPKQRRPDNALAKRLLDWEPRVRVEDGLHRTIEYFRQEIRDRGDGLNAQALSGTVHAAPSC